MKYSNLTLPQRAFFAGIAGGTRLALNDMDVGEGRLPWSGAVPRFDDEDLNEEDRAKMGREYDAWLEADREFCNEKVFAGHCDDGKFDDARRTGSNAEYEST